MTLSWHGNAFPIAGPLCGYQSPRNSPKTGCDAELSCFLCSKIVQAFEESVRLLVIWHVMALMWRHCNMFNIGIQHFSDVIMRALSSQITGFSIVCSTVCLDADQWNHQSSASLAGGIPSQRAKSMIYIYIFIACIYQYFAKRINHLLICLNNINHMIRNL